MNRDDKTEVNRERSYEQSQIPRRRVNYAAEREYEQNEPDEPDEPNGHSGYVSGIIAARQMIIAMFKKYETPVTYVSKFLLAVTVFMAVRGYFTELQNAPVNFRLGGFSAVLLLSFISAVVPAGWFFGLIWLFVTLNAFYISLELSVITGAFLLCVILFYVRIFPKESYLIILLILCLKLKIPYFAVLFAGLFAGLQSIGALVLGTLLWSIATALPHSGITGITGNVLSDLNLLSLPENFSAAFEIIIHMLADNNAWIQVSLAFAVSASAVRIVSKLPVSYSMEAGLLAGTLALIAGSLLSRQQGLALLGFSGAFGIIISAVFSILPAYICKFFYIIVDYSKAESVAFQDDDYLYYVKAIPKIKYKI